MKLKSYFAATVEAAMNTARLELGDDAMLVSTKRTGDEFAHMGEYEVVFATAHGAASDDSHHSPAQVAPGRARPLERLSEEVAGLKHEMEKLASSLARSTAGIANIATNPDLAEAFSQLVAAELDPAVAQDVLTRIASQVSHTGAVSSIGWKRLIAAELSRVVNVDSRLPSSPKRKVIALAGPPGAGKTTTLIKLAIRYGLATRRPSHILTLDSHRVAATEPLRSYAAITGLGFSALETPRGLAQALEEFRSKDLIFVDLPSLVNGEFDDTTAVAKLISQHPQIETHLVLSASMKPADMNRIAQQYEMFGPAKLIFTHLDETTTFGPLLNISLRRGKPVSFLSRGPQVPEALEPALRENLVDLVLKEMQPGSEELISKAVA